MSNLATQLNDLERLKALKEQGVITEKEFKNKKKNILAVSDTTSQRIWKWTKKIICGIIIAVAILGSQYLLYNYLNSVNKKSGNDQEKLLNISAAASSEVVESQNKVNKDPSLTIADQVNGFYSSQMSTLLRIMGIALAFIGGVIGILLPLYLEKNREKSRKKERKDMLSEITKTRKEDKQILKKSIEQTKRELEYKFFSWSAMLQRGSKDYRGFVVNMIRAIHDYLHQVEQHEPQELNKITQYLYYALESLEKEKIEFLEELYSQVMEHLRAINHTITNKTGIREDIKLLAHRIIKHLEDSKDSMISQS